MVPVTSLREFQVLNSDGRAADSDQAAAAAAAPAGAGPGRLGCGPPVLSCIRGPTPTLSRSEGGPPAAPGPQGRVASRSLRVSRARGRRAVRPGLPSGRPGTSFPHPLLKLKINVSGSEISAVISTNRPCRLCR
jgi:hypothetical protein